MLPEKWCVRSNNIEAAEYFNEQSKLTCYYLKGTKKPGFETGYLNSINLSGTEIREIREKAITKKDASFHSNAIRSGFTEISNEEFNTHILNANTNTVKNNYSIF